MANSMTDQYLANNTQYAGGQPTHKPSYPGKQPIQPAKRVAVVACMDARLDVEDLLGLQTGDAHIIRNAGGVVTDDAMRCLIISHHLLNTNEIILIHHTRCGMLAFTDDLLKAGLEGDAAAEKLLGQATGRAFTSCKKCASTPSQFHGHAHAHGRAKGQRRGVCHGRRFSLGKGAHQDHQPARRSVCAPDQF